LAKHPDWLLKKSVTGMSFWLRFIAAAEFVLLTSAKWQLSQWGLSVG